MMTITEALAEMKTLDKRIDGKITSVVQYSARPMLMKDPLEKDGGSEKFVSEAMQSAKDLISRKTLIRVAIQRVNQSTKVLVQGEVKTISEWLAWRKESAPFEMKLIQSSLAAISSVRNNVAKNHGGGEYTQITTNVSEAELTSRSQQITHILGDLDGKLSLANATTTIEF